jgi:hypothetical protein
MQVQEEIIKAINTALKNPIYQTMRLLGIKTILKSANFVKKREGVSVYLVVLHFVYMLVMNKKISTFIKQSSESFKKDVYYRLLQNSSYNWRKLLSLTTLKILKLLHKLQDPSTTKVLIIDDTVEGKTGKKIEGSSELLWSNKEKRKIRGINVVSLNYSDGYSSFMIDFAIAMNNYAKVKLQHFTQKLDYRSVAYKRRLELTKTKLELSIDMIKRAIKAGIQADFLLVDSWYSKPAFIKQMNDLGLRVVTRIVNNNKIWNFMNKEKTLNAIYNKSANFGKLNLNTIINPSKDLHLFKHFITNIIFFFKIFYIFSKKQYL